MHSIIKLAESRLGEIFGVSRTKIREALESGALQLCLLTDSREFAALRLVTGRSAARS